MTTKKILAVEDDANGNGTPTAYTMTGAIGAAALTTITIADAAGTPDYAIAAVTNSSPYGFSNAAETITLLYIIKNLQLRVAALETALGVS